MYLRNGGFCLASHRKILNQSSAYRVSHCSTCANESIHPSISLHPSTWPPQTYRRNAKEQQQGMHMPSEKENRKNQRKDVNCVHVGAEDRNNRNCQPVVRSHAPSAPPLPAAPTTLKRLLFFDIRNAKAVKSVLRYKTGSKCRRRQTLDIISDDYTYKPVLSRSAASLFTLRRPSN